MLSTWLPNDPYGIILSFEIGRKYIHIFTQFNFMKRFPRLHKLYDITFIRLQIYNNVTTTIGLILIMRSRKRFPYIIKR